jgi:hypothetical protein
MSTRPTDLYVNNHWYIELPGLVSPKFHQVSGIEESSGEVSIVDGYRNVEHKFSSQLKKYNDIVLHRAKDGSVDDISMRELVRACMNNGLRFDANLVKLHNGIEVFRILMLGVRVKNNAHPDLNTAGEDRYDMKYTCSVSEWIEI